MIKNISTLLGVIIYSIFDGFSKYMNNIAFQNQSITMAKCLHPKKKEDNNNKNN